jgi:predicted dehydrogenase
MKAVIIGTSGHIDLALGVRDRLPQLKYVGIAPGSADEDAKDFYVEQMEPSLIPFYNDYRTMLDTEKPDLAIVAPFFFLQARIAGECLARGISVFVEKPMAVSMEQLERLRRIHAQGRAALCPMLPSRYHPEMFAAWRAVVKEGAVGEPLLVTAQKSYKLGSRHPMYTHRATYGGTIPWVAIHAMDWVHWVTQGRIAEVSASHTTAGNRGHGEMESSGLCFYRLSNSGAATVSCDYFRPGSAPTHGEDRLRIAGERGVVEVTGGEARLTTADGSRLLEREEPRSLFVEFIHSLEQGSGMRISAEEAFSVCELALKSREAADTKTTVRLRA